MLLSQRQQNERPFRRFNNKSHNFNEVSDYLTQRDSFTLELRIGLWWATKKEISVTVSPNTLLATSKDVPGFLALAPVSSWSTKAVSVLGKGVTL